MVPLKLVLLMQLKLGKAMKKNLFGVNQWS